MLLGCTHGVTSYLQQILDYADRVILRNPKSASITTHLIALHWLPVKVRRTCKIASLCYQCHNSTAPLYVTDMIQKKPLHSCDTRSSSHTLAFLNIRTLSKAPHGDRSFSFASSVWNSIPNYVKCVSSRSFKSRLKMCLFRSVFKERTS